MNTLGTRRWWALGALTLAVLAVGLDGTVLSVALPRRAAAVEATGADQAQSEDEPVALR